METNRKKQLKIKKIIKEFITKFKVFFAGATIGKGSIIERNVQLSKGVKIGNNCYIGPNCNIRGDIEIGNYTLFADNICFVGGEYDYECVGSPIASGYKSYSSIKTKIGRDVLIGHNVTIVRGIVIGDCAIVAAGSVVTKNISPFEIVGGVPAKFIKNRFNTDEDRKIHLERLSAL